MLQISTGKFFKYEAHETLRRAIYYTNYISLSKADRIETPVGSLQPASKAHGLGTLTCEIIERIEKLQGEQHVGEIVATGGDTLVNDFAAIISFALNVTCVTDLDLARRLIASERPTLGTDSVPQKFIPRMFDRTVISQPEDAGDLQRFITNLMALERKSYEAVMRAIRRYVIGAHRVTDDMNLAYALFVMSMESLAQEFDRFEPSWEDYDQKKRGPIDEALLEAPKITADKVRAAILAGEHVAITRRFCEFALDHTLPSFFRTEAEAVSGAISRPDLSVALRQAYQIRSSYVHQLQNIPRLLAGLEGFHETTIVDARPALTFAGLTRLARHVINTFVARAPKVQTEEFDWSQDLPGMLRLPLDPQYWIGHPKAFNTATAQTYLEAFIGQVIGKALQESTVLTDIRPVLGKVEEIVPGLANPSQRLPMLALYFIFNSLVSEEVRCAEYLSLFERYRRDFDTPSIVSLAAHFLTSQIPDWSLIDMEELHAQYFRTRHHAATLRLGRPLEAAFSLRLAEQYRSAGNFTRARQLIGFAVEAWPNSVRLRNFEASLPLDTFDVINWPDILLPASAGTDQTTRGDQKL